MSEDRTMSDDSHNGWANRETWAFWLWVNNDQGWYESVREAASAYLDELDWAYDDEGERIPFPEGHYDYELGERVVDYVKETLDELEDSYRQAAWDNGYTFQGYRRRASESLGELRIMRDDIGSFWRIDYSEIGAAAREMVEES